MARLIRGAVVAFLAVLVGLAGALPSQALVSPSPSPSTDGPVYGCLDPVDEYGVPRQCQLNIQILSPVCDNEVPKLRYKVVAVGTPNTKVTITWVNPGGDDVVYADLPLEGTVNWPGAVEGPDGKGIDWPGWRQLADKSWVEGDEFDWVRPSVNVLFQVNPELTVPVAYPPSSPNCHTDPPGEDEVLAVGNPKAAVLSATGSDSGPLLAAAAGLVVVGAGAVTMVAIARRRRAML
ncbi:peptidase [uncultured Cellulomonas sp.]|uniref:peptidase n=1 Tax=uncultured Cellulomonas sp. TaxID=189682 RepID=UPI0028EEDA85|nr:peptidase [uncultured Cellulomonas sp.]